MCYFIESVTWFWTTGFLFKYCPLRTSCDLLESKKDAVVHPTYRPAYAYAMTLSKSKAKGRIEYIEEMHRDPTCLNTILARKNPLVA